MVYYANERWVTNNHRDYSSDKTASNKDKMINSQFHQFGLQNFIQVQGVIKLMVTVDTAIQ
jgi:hypothetical protein